MNTCIACGLPGLFNLKSNNELWYCMAHAMEKADILKAEAK